MPRPGLNPHAVLPTTASFSRCRVSITSCDLGDKALHCEMIKYVVKAQGFEFSMAATRLCFWSIHPIYAFDVDVL